MDIKVSSMSSDGTVEVFLDGWLDTQHAPELANALSGLGPEVKRLVLDATNLAYISSAGIRQIVAAQRLLKGEVTLRHPQEEVMRVLRLVGLDKHLDIQQ